MILETDFLDHWKTRLLIDTLGEEIASNYVLRLWFHCQNRKSIHFKGMTPQMLKAVCRYPGDPHKLMDAMISCGFIEYDGDTVSVPKWAEINSKFTSNWSKGQATAESFKRKLEGQREANGRPNEGQAKAKGGPTEGQREAKGEAHSKDSKDSKEEEKEGVEDVRRHQPDSVLSEFSPEVKTAAIQAAIAYQTRRYGGPNPSASWYPNLLREAAAIFEVHQPPDEALEKFKAACAVKPTLDLPRDATFAQLAMNCGIKKSTHSTREPPWEAAKKQADEEGRRKLHETVARLNKEMAC